MWRVRPPWRRGWSTARGLTPVGRVRPLAQPVPAGGEPALLSGHTPVSRSGHTPVDLFRSGPTPVGPVGVGLGPHVVLGRHGNCSQQWLRRLQGYPRILRGRQHGYSRIPAVA